jgi:hypothetical protein
MFKFFQILDFDPFLAGNGYETEKLDMYLIFKNFHYRLRVLLFDPPTSFSLKYGSSKHHLNIFFFSPITRGRTIWQYPYMMHFFL